MYYVNRQQIEIRLQFIPEIIRVLRSLQQTDPESPLYLFAEERALHLAVETVTDIGSYLIDGFLMRDASSYEDIVEILRDEQVVSPDLARPLLELVELRKPLVQQYFDLERDRLLPVAHALLEVLPQFADAVREYLEANG
ncbi:DUF86 domain-containing protein [Ferviditalea candida]|uniref:DUF86 domain-containing protein n=1 Tax=Ferviditalea candida TaxID=3108399 RepID=A0ABU5ZF26_9BACL|nr:DUF86 domain-containing protein [Paenibacillaceae bacterium T2]